VLALRTFVKHNKFMSDPIDHRIFGFQLDGQLRANLYNGVGLPDAGKMYSWAWAPTSEQLSNQLAKLWEQPLSEDEWYVIEELEAADDEFEMACDTCGGDGRDHGSLHAFEPEDCPSCHGTGQESYVPMLTRRPAGREAVNSPTRQEVA